MIRLNWFIGSFTPEHREAYTYFESVGQRVGVSIQGHAEGAGLGENIVCAGFSTLFFTLIEALKKKKFVPPIGKKGSPIQIFPFKHLFYSIQLNQLGLNRDGLGHQTEIKQKKLVKEGFENKLNDLVESEIQSPEFHSIKNYWEMYLIGVDLLLKNHPEKFLVKHILLNSQEGKIPEK